MAQRPTKPGVERLPTGVSSNFRRQPGKQTFESFGAVTLQGEEVLQLVYDSLDELPLSGRSSSSLFGPRPPRALLRGGGYQRSMLL